MTLDRETRTVFEDYLALQYEQEGAITYGQKMAVVERLLREAREQGIVPIAQGKVARVRPDDPAVRAILEGRAVSLGGARAASAGKAGGLQALGTGARLGIMGGMLLAILVFVVVALMVFGKPKEVAEATTPSPSPSATATTGPSPTATATATLTPTLAVGPGTVKKPTPTPYNVQLYVDEAAGGGNDPASVEIAGSSFVLGQSEPRSGVWSINGGGGEWLRQSEVRRVVAVPYSRELADTVGKLAPGDLLRLRLRSGEVVEFRVGEVQRVKRQQIEVLTERNPSLAVVLYGERAGERWVVAGDAVQRTDDFAIYTPVAISATLPFSGTVVPYPTPTPTAIGGTPIPAIPQVIITDTLVVTNRAAGLELAVSECARVVQVGTAKPENQSWQFMSCLVTLTALRDDAHYSGFAIAATEMDWITATEGWWPQQMSVPEGLGEGYLKQGESIVGKVAGVIVKKQQLPGGPRTRPVVVWEQAGLRYVVDVGALLH
jgi:hypothetical protein